MISLSITRSCTRHYKKIILHRSITCIRNINIPNVNPFHVPRKLIKKKPFTPCIRLYSSKDAESLIEVTADCLSTHNDYILVDVRGKDEIQQNGSIPGAYNIPLDELLSSFELPDDKFVQRYGFENTDENCDKIIYYCHSGIRSMVALNLSRNLGYDKVKHLKGGYMQWMLHDKVEKE